TDAVLALDADVEQVHLEADGRGDAGEVERRGVVEDVDDVAVLGPGQHRRPEGAHVVPAHHEDERRDDRGDHQGEQGRGDGQQHTAYGAHADASATVIAEPSSCGVTVCGSRSPANAPRSTTAM